MCPTEVSIRNQDTIRLSAKYAKALSDFGKTVSQSFSVQLRRIPFAMYDKYSYLFLGVTLSPDLIALIETEGVSCATS
jgi:hypothetical protein